MPQPSVLIIGAGPVGQMAALLLARQGIPTHLIDRRTGISAAPKAHAVNPRTLEICQSVGIDAAAIRAAGTRANDGGWVRFVGTLTGPQFGVLPYERMDDGAFDATPFPLTNIPQPRFEAMLEDAIDAEPLITFERGVTCISLAQSGSGVTAGLARAAEPGPSAHTYAYAIAADGAGSRMRDMLGIAMQGPESLQNYITIHFEADLRALTDDRPAVLYFLFDPATQGVLIAYDRADTWVLMHPFDPAAETVDDYDDARCAALVRNAVGADIADLAIRTRSHWAMSAQIAEAYRAGRVFLAGDAAHRFPPTGGLGLNTGVGDAQNIAWKLAAVLKGEAGSALLDTYEAERRPVAQINTEQSMVNAAKIFDLFTALYGDAPDDASTHFAGISADPEAIRSLHPVIEAQRPHFDSFNLQLGFRYVSPAVIDPAPMPPVAEIETSRFAPTCEPGARLPHCWITRDRQQTSLLDLLPVDRFALLTGPKANGRFNDAAAIVKTIAPGTDFEAAGFDWERFTGLPPHGALLIRPDGHIAARLTGSDADNPLNAILATVLARA